MEEGTKEKEDTPRGGAAKKKNSAADKTNADGADASSRPPSRVHIFKGKSPGGAPSKSKDEPLQCSGFRLDTLARLGPGTGQVAAVAGIQSSVLRFKDEMTRLKIGIENGKRAVWKMAMQVEDLQGMRQTLRQTRQSIFKTRR
jgi:hypothetical protein